MKRENMPRWLAAIPPVTRNLLIINILLWLVEMILPKFGSSLLNMLGLHYWEANDFNPIQLITYMFMHDNHSFTHILFNMFSLWMFGRLMEQVWGSRRFFIYYFVCGLGAAVIQELVWTMSWWNYYIDGIASLNKLSYQDMETIVQQGLADGDEMWINAVATVKNEIMCVGASGAIFGILLGFAFVFPNIPLYFFFIPVPIKAKYMVIGYAVIEFFLGISNSGPAIAHFAHLGGMIFGLILLLWWKHKGTLRGNSFY
jgi:membrane associated rhomboid family serine protease